MNTIFVVFAKDLKTNLVDPIAGYYGRKSALDRLSLERKKSKDSNHRFWIDLVKVETAKTGA